MGLYYCSPNKARPSGSQHYYLGHNRDIEYYSDSAYCIENYGGTIQLHACTHQQGNQYFRYDLHTQQIRAGTDETMCLQADEDNGNISVKSCNGQEVRQKWKWGHMNESNLNNWDDLGAPIKN